MKNPQPEEKAQPKKPVVPKPSLKPDPVVEKPKENSKNTQPKPPPKEKAKSSSPPKPYHKTATQARRSASQKRFPETAKINQSRNRREDTSMFGHLLRTLPRSHDTHPGLIFRRKCRRCAGTCPGQIRSRLRNKHAARKVASSAHRETSLKPSGQTGPPRTTSTRPPTKTTSEPEGAASRSTDTSSSGTRKWARSASQTPRDSLGE